MGGCNMLCQFTFENYKAFKQEATLDFLAEPIKEHTESLITEECSGEAAVPAIVIYGPNGGGKSTVLEALIFLRNIVLQAVLLVKGGNNKEKYEEIFRNSSREIYYKFSAQCQDLPTKFDLMFFAGKKKFRYQFSVIRNKIVEENLYLQAAGTKDVKLIFERSEEECILGEEVEDIAVGKVNDTMPLLSHIAMNYDIEVIEMVIDWFLGIELLNYDDPKREMRLILPEIPPRRQPPRRRYWPGPSPTPRRQSRRGRPAAKRRSPAPSRRWRWPQGC